MKGNDCSMDNDSCKVLIDSQETACMQTHPRGWVLPVTFRPTWTHCQVNSCHLKGHKGIVTALTKSQTIDSTVDNQIASIRND